MDLKDIKFGVGMTMEGPVEKQLNDLREVVKASGIQEIYYEVQVYNCLSGHCSSYYHLGVLFGKRDFPTATLSIGFGRDEEVKVFEYMTGIVNIFKDYKPIYIDSIESEKKH